MKQPDRAGFSIIELAIVVLIIGILAALAIPLYALITEKTRFSTLANDLRTFSEAFQTYALEENDYPPSYTIPGTYPPNMEGVLSPRWLENSPIGGAYIWERTVDPDPAKESAFIQLIEEIPNNPFTVDLADVEKLDEDIDDGNLATGYLQVAGNRIRYFIVLGDN